ncbi:DUF6053 domain-containing protein [Lysobacter enzymogenes]|uniref:DUF6053 domain-containing protein n=1 Tax=Lysobacter enzymogenes TaxID=69 RepID=UPI003D18B983
MVATWANGVGAEAPPTTASRCDRCVREMAFGALVGGPSGPTLFDPMRWSDLSQQRRC